MIIDNIKKILEKDIEVIALSKAELEEMVKEFDELKKITSDLQNKLIGLTLKQI